MIALTRRLIAVLLVLMGAAFGQTPWVASARVGNEARFLYSSTVQRYDLVQQSWLAAYPLPFGNVTAMAADASGSVITTGTAIYRGGADFSGQTPLAIAPGNIWALYLDGNLVIAVHESSGSGSSGSGSVTTYDRTTGAKISNQYPQADGLIGTSLAPQSRRLFGRDRSNSAGGLITINYNSDGTVGDTLTSPYHGNMPNMFRTWVFPDETKVMDDAGTVYSAPGMKFLGGLGGAVTDVAWNGTTAIVLRAGKLYAYGADLLEAGQASTSPAGAGVFVNGTNAYVFSPSGTRPVASIVPLSSIAPVVPGSPVNPLGAAFTPDSVYYATNGDVILFSKALKSLFRWSAASHSYTQSVPLLDAPAYAAYSKDSDLVYLVYSNGAINKVDFTASQPQEVRLASVSTVPNGLAAAGNFAVVSTNTPTTEVDHYIFDSTGTLRSIYTGGYYIGSSWAWDPATRKLYFFGLSALSNEMIDQTGTVITTGQISFSGNLYGTPIRLSADGKKVVLGNGTIYSIGQFQSELLATVTSPVVDAVWSGDRLLTLMKNGVSSQILAWSGAKYTQEAATLTLNGTPVSLTPFGDSFVATTVVGGVPRYTIFDSTLKVVYTSPSQPVSPAGLAFTSRTTTTVDLQWQDLSDNETGFLVEYRLAGGAWQAGPTTGPGVTSAEVGGLTAGTAYEFRVSAVADTSVSIPSAVVATSTYSSPDQPAGEPYNLTAAQIFANKITLQWQDNATNESNFLLYRSTNANLLGATITLPPNTTSYVDSGLAANTTYYYHIQTFSAGLSGDLSAALSVRTLAANKAPAQVSDVTVQSAGAGIVNISWTDASVNEDQFIIRRITYPGNGYEEVGRVGYNVTSFTDTTALPNVTYYYEVIAANSSGQSGGVGSAAVTTPKAGGTYTGLCCQSGGVYYFAFLGPMRVERYDMAAGQWLAAVPLSDTPGALWVDESGIYVGEGKSMVRYDLTGTNRTVLATANSAISSLFTLGRVLGYGVPQYATGTGITTIDKTTGQALSSFDSMDDARIFSVDPSRNRVFGRSYGYSPGNLAYMQINQDGTLASSGQDPYFYIYNPGQRTFVFPDGSRVADDSGNFYSADSIVHMGTLGDDFTDLAFYGVDVPVVLRYDTVYAYNNVFQQTGSAPVGLTTGLRVAVQGSNALVFAEDYASTHGIQIKAIALSALNAPQPGQAIDPRGLAFTPDDLFQDRDGNVLLFSRSQTSLFRWSPALGTYASTIPLVGAADHAAYSKENNALYFEYASQIVRKLDLDADTPGEETFYTTPKVPRGLATAGDYVVAGDDTGTWGTHYILRPDGTLADSSNMRFPSSTYTWDEVKRRLYYFWEYSGPVGLLYETIDASGRITDDLETPSGDRSVSLAGPIRVSPDGSKLAFGSGQVMETTGLTVVDGVSVGFTDAVWRDSGLVTIQAGASGTDVKAWDPVTLSPRSTLVSLTGTPLRIFGLDGDRMVVVTLDQSMPRFYILSATGAVELDYVSTVPHLVGAPPAATEDVPYSWQPQIELSPGSTTPATIAAVSLPSWLKLVNGSLVGTPLEADSGDPQTPEVYHPVVLSVTDNTGTSQRTMQIPVIWVNDPPVLPASVPALVADAQGDPVSFDFGAVMQDPDRNDPHTWSITGDTTPGIFTSLSLDAAGKLSATFAPYVSGTAEVGVLVQDSSGATAVSTVSIVLPELPAPTITTTGGVVLNRVTGLYEQTITITNVAGRAIGGFDLAISGLGDGVQLYNGSSAAAGSGTIAYHQPISAGGSLQMVLQYYAAVRGNIAPPTIAATTALPQATAAAGDHETFAINRMSYISGGTILEFTAEIGKSYQVQYSDDLVNWKTCPYPLRAGGTKVQWIDRGPPSTDVSPSTISQRFYRIQSAGE